MTSPSVTELRRNGNTMVKRPAANRAGRGQAACSDALHRHHHAQPTEQLQPHMGPSTGSCSTRTAARSCPLNTTTTKEPS